MNNNLQGHIHDFLHCALTCSPVQRGLTRNGKRTEVAQTEETHQRRGDEDEEEEEEEEEEKEEEKEEEEELTQWSEETTTKRRENWGEVRQTENERERERTQRRRILKTRYLSGDAAERNGFWKNRQLREEVRQVFKQWDTYREALAQRRGSFEKRKRKGRRDSWGKR